MTETGTPRPELTGGGPATTVCGIPTPAGKPCALRDRHPGRCESLRNLTDPEIVRSIEPAWHHATCCACRKPFPQHGWMLRLPEVNIAHETDGLILCASCAGKIARAALTIPAGPAPDPEES